jgi:hypothetical protein
VGADGLPVISYSKGFGTLKVAHCADVACSTAAVITTLATPGSDIRSTSITIGADGLPFISFAGDHKLVVAHCNDRTCATFTITDVDTARTHRLWELGRYRNGRAASYQLL